MGRVSPRAGFIMRRVETAKHGQRNVLTTGEVARICNVAPRTVSKWFDAGQLRGYRIPGSKDRRIPVEHLVRFMRAHGIPLNGLDTGRTRVLILDSDPALAESLRDALERTERFEAFCAGSTLEAGAMVAHRRPQVVIVDVSSMIVPPRGFAAFFRGAPETSETTLIAVGTGLLQGKGQALIQDGFDSFLNKPFEVRALLDLLDTSDWRDEPR